MSYALWIVFFISPILAIIVREKLTLEWVGIVLVSIIMCSFVLRLYASIQIPFVGWMAILLTASFIGYLAKDIGASVRSWVSQPRHGGWILLGALFLILFALLGVVASLELAAVAALLVAGVRIMLKPLKKR
jgi:hypothetical protein